MGSRHYLRSPKLIVATTRTAVLLVQPSGATRTIRTRRVRAWSMLMQELVNPLPWSTVRALCECAEVGAEEWQELVGDGFIIVGEEMALAQERSRVFTDNQGFDFTPGPARCNHLVLACTGSVTTGLVAPSILSLMYSGFQTNLDVILTEAAQRFITRDLLEAYGIRTWVDAFERKGELHVPHVHLGRAADCVLVLPATASSLHRIASAACTDMVGLVISVTSAPVVVAPAMNDAMWNHAGVQRNVEQLRADGVYVMEPTLIFGAADVASKGAAMFGGHAPLWSGPASLKLALAAIIEHAGSRALRAGHEPSSA